MSTAWIDVEIVATTAAAVLVASGDAEAWIPRSQIIDSADDLERGAHTEIEISEWLATQKGLV